MIANIVVNKLTDVVAAKKLLQSCFDAVGVIVTSALRCEKVTT